MKILEKIEAAFEKRNRYDLATHLRHFEMHFASTKSRQIQNQWQEKCQREEYRGFSMLQREIYLKEEMAACVKVARLRPLTSGEVADLQAWEEELKEFDQKYWLHTRAWYKLMCEKPKGPSIREWDASSRMEAMLSTEIRYFCTANGGCCGRECGCCERPLKTHREKNRYGHCTMECGCCIRNRGFYRVDPCIERAFSIETDIS
jgi:hypothetical protein